MNTMQALKLLRDYGYIVLKDHATRQDENGMKYVNGYQYFTYDNEECVTDYEWVILNTCGPTSDMYEAPIKILRSNGDTITTLEALEESLRKYKTPA